MLYISFNGSELVFSNIANNRFAVLLSAMLINWCWQIHVHLFKIICITDYVIHFLKLNLYGLINQLQVLKSVVNGETTVGSESAKIVGYNENKKNV